MNLKLIASCLAGAALVAACGGSDNIPPAPQAKISVPELATGSYKVSLGDETAPTVGQYYAGADGSRLLIVNGTDERASTLYKRASGGEWQRVPAATADVSASLLRNDVTTLSSTDSTALAGHYTVKLASGVSGFMLGTDGKLTVENGASCAISGSLGDVILPGVRKATVAFAGCSSLPASAQGVAVQDGDYAPARLRLVLDDGKQVVEVWAYRE